MHQGSAHFLLKMFFRSILLALLLKGVPMPLFAATGHLYNEFTVVAGPQQERGPIPNSPVIPNPKLTPGDLCTDEDPDFEKYDYLEDIPRCRRHTTIEQKYRIAARYGEIPRTDWPQYEFDHLIPLCAGGSNSEKNIWPQPKSQALEKDRLEDKVCSALKKELMTQRQAIAKIYQWFEELSHRGNDQDNTDQRNRQNRRQNKNGQTDTDSGVFEIY